MDKNTGVYLLLGSNKGDRNENLATALRAIDSTLGNIKNKSSVYQTEAWGKTDQPPFYNQVLEIETSLSPQEVLKEILRIEQRMGRQRNEKWGERIIDIDILFYGNQIVETSNLVIPHPQLANRKFTLVPLNEIASGLIHPKLEKKISELMMDCQDPLDVSVIDSL